METMLVYSERLCAEWGSLSRLQTLTGMLPGPPMVSSRYVSISRK